MGEDKFKSLYRKYVEAEKKKGGRDFHFDENKTEETAESCPNMVLSKSRSKRIIRQSVRGRYGIKVHPIGGNLKLSTIETLIGLLGNFECPKLRLGMDESLYIMDLNSDEFDILKKATDCSSFETNIDSTISCIGVPICQVGIQTSQSLTAAISAYYNKRKASYKLKNALPVIHISGCQNSCGAHQIGGIGFTGTKKRTDAGVKDAYIMSLMGSYTAGSARLADKVGCFEASDIPAMLYQIGTMVLEEKKDICTLHEEKSKKLDALLAAYRM